MTSRQLLPFVVLSLTLAVPVPARAAAVAATPTPSASSSAASGDWLGYFVVPNIDEAFAHMEAASAAFAPAGGAQAPGALKKSLGEKLGDPELVHLQTTRPLMVGFLQAAPLQPPALVVLLPSGDEAYAPLFAALSWKTKSAPGLLIAASTPDALLKASSLTDEYARIEKAATPLRADLRLHLETARMMAAFGPFLQMGVDAALAKMEAGPPVPEENEKEKGAGKAAASKATPPTKEMLRLAKLEAKVFLDLLSQVQDMDSDLSLSAEAFASETRLKAKTGTALADLAAMPAPGANRARALVSGNGFMRFASAYDSKTSGAFMLRLARDLAQDPEGAALIGPDLLALVEKWADVSTGDAAYLMKPSASSPIALEMALGVKDEAKALALMESTVALMGPGGLGQKLLGPEAPITTTFTRDVRRHAGVPVHRYKTSLEKKDAKPEEQAMLKALMSGVEVAFAGGYYLSSQDPAALDVLIDRAKGGATGTGLTLEAQTVFGEGRHLYVDYDLGGLLKAVGSMAAAAPGQPNPFLGLTGGHPMLMAMGASSGNILMQIRFPLALFSEMAKSAAAKKAETPAAGPAPAPNKKKGR
jgi:hypothetical protein